MIMHNSILEEGNSQLSSRSNQVVPCGNSQDRSPGKKSKDDDELKKLKRRNMKEIESLEKQEADKKGGA
jgi:hypothetical protein